MYLLFLDENFAEQEKYDWHLTQKKALNQLKEEKQLIENSAPKVDVSNAAIGEGMKEEVTHKLK